MYGWPGHAVAVTAVAAVVAVAHAAGPTTPSLVPDAVPSARDAPLYWCSWLAQGRMWLANASTHNVSTVPTLEAYWRSRTHTDFMDQSNAANVFSNGSGSASGRVGWAWQFPAARKDLIFVLDNGWQDGAESVSKSLTLSPSKYPEFASGNKTEAIGRLAAKVTALGWKGLGLWTAGGGAIGPDLIAVLGSANVALLKFDGGDTACSETAIARQAAPNVVVEHGDCGGDCPLNAAVGSDGRWPLAAATSQAKALHCTDLFRTYDMVKILSVSEVLDRQAKLILVAHNMSVPAEAKAMNPSPRRLFGGSGEPVVTAALGGSIQPMRGNLRGTPLPPLFEIYAGEGPRSRQRQHREDEIVRLARWARIAPPFGVGPQSDGTMEAAPLLDPVALIEAHNFSLCDDACVISHKLEGKVVEQGAPARVTRNGLPLPDVKMPPPGIDPPPFVIATRFPGGKTFSVTTVGRQLLSGWVEARAQVTLRVPAAASDTGVHIGVFGYYEQLTVVFEGGQRGDGVRTPTVLAQDLAGDTPEDISSDVVWSGATVTIPGAVIEKVGLAARSREDDVSAPGLVLRVA